jgi:hypothetical protein
LPGSSVEKADDLRPDVVETEAQRRRSRSAEELLDAAGRRFPDALDRRGKFRERARVLCGTREVLDGVVELLLELAPPSPLPWRRALIVRVVLLIAQRRLRSMPWT